MSKSKYYIPNVIATERSIALGANRVMDVNRSMVEEGILFRGVYSDPAMSGNHQIVINTPAAEQAHLLPLHFASTGTRYRLAKATAYQTGMVGTITLLNMNRNSSATASSVVAVDPVSAPSLGTAVLEDRYDSLQPIDAEIILDPSSTYVLQFDKPVATSPALSVELTLYEIDQ